MTNQECSLLGFLGSFLTPLVGGVTGKSALKIKFKMASNFVLLVGVLFVYFHSAYT